MKAQTTIRLIAAVLRLYFLAVLLPDFVQAQSETPAFHSVATAGGIASDQAWAVAVDGHGNRYVTGLFQGLTKFGSVNLTNFGSSDIFLAKYDSLNRLVWVKQCGGTGIDQGGAVAVGPDGNIYLTGDFQYTARFGAFTVTNVGGISRDAFIAKYDPSGNIFWIRQTVGTGQSYGGGIVVDAGTNVYVTGYFQGNTSFGSTNMTGLGGNEMFLAKYDRNGNLLWTRQAGGTGPDTPNGIALDLNTNIYVAAKYYSSNFFIGNLTLTNAGKNDLLLAKYDRDGNLLWAKRGGGTDFDSADSVAVDRSGNCFVSGTFRLVSTFDSFSLTNSGFWDDIFIAKCDPAGNISWIKQITGYSTDSVRGIAVDIAGHAYICGTYDSTNFNISGVLLTNNNSTDLFVAKYGNSGDLHWAKRAGSGKLDVAYGIAVDLVGNVHVTGWFGDVIHFDSLSRTPVGNIDIFLATINGPQLSITRSGGVMTVLWPTNDLGLMLQKASGLASNSLWLTLISGITNSGSNYQYLSSVGSFNQFYRLRSTNGVLVP